MTSRANLALTVGDPAGIGPEIVRACLARREAWRGRMRLVAIGPESERPKAIACVDPAGWIGFDDDAVWLTTDGAGDWSPGRPQASAGRAALAARMA